MESPENRPKLPRWWQNEDWLAVLVGGLLIAIVLAGWRPAFPSFSWMTSAHLAKGIHALQQQTGEISRLQLDAVNQAETGLATALAELGAALGGADPRAVRGAVKQV